MDKKHLFKCKECGIEFERPFSKVFKRGDTTCLGNITCSNSKSFKRKQNNKKFNLSFDEVKRRIPNYLEVLEFTTAGKMSIFRCNICGEIINRTLDGIFYSKDDLCCTNVFCEKYKPGKKFTLKQARDIVFSMNATPLFTEYLNSHQKLLIQCNCGNNFNRTMASIRKKGFLCRCSECKKKSLIGKKSPLWNYNLTDEVRFSRRKSPENTIFIQQVLKLCNYKCVVTGKKSSKKDKLVVHHIYNYGHYPNFRFQVNNGTALLQSVHSNFHTKFGYGYNTLDQFKQFFKEQTNIDYITDLEDVSSAIKRI